MKKVFLAAAVLLCTVGFAFAAPKAVKSSKNAICLDVVPLFKGFAAWDEDAETQPFGAAFSYERYLNKGFSILGRFGFYGGKVNQSKFFFWEADIHGRYYPMGRGFSGLFIDTGLGMNRLTCEDMSYDKFFGAKFSESLGWKFIFARHLVCEPRVSYVLAKAVKDMSFTPVGWQIGFNFGAAF
jgi:hypothetical protein